MRSQIKKLSRYVSFIEAPEYTFPYCNSIYINDDICMLVDSSVTDDMFNYLQTRHIDWILSTHGHVDHNMHNYDLRRATVMTHANDQPYSNQDGFGKALGVHYFPDIASFLSINKLGYRFRAVSENITDGQVLDLGHTRIEVIHLPGHTPGHCGLFFSDMGLLFSADIDLGQFGPWYGNTGSNVDAFVNSIEQVINMKPDYLITSHASGLITSNMQSRLIRYRDIIFKRERAVIEAIHRGRHSLWEIVDENIIYRKFYQPQWRYFEWFMIRTHLDRLIKYGKVIEDGDKFYLKDGVRTSNINLA